MPDFKDQCRCGHIMADHIRSNKYSTFGCGKANCKCYKFSPEKIASPAGKKGVVDHDDLMVFCNEDHQLYPYNQAVMEFFGIEENIFGEDVVEFRCALCGATHQSRVLGRR